MRQDLNVTVAIRIRISIHAPTWGATSERTRTILGGEISIHAPTWGATQRDQQAGYYRLISIHAPTWGATQVDWRRSPHSCISIHAPTWGATLDHFFDSAWFVKFQSTHPRGVRPRLRACQPTAPSNFNPRTHVGCDHQPRAVHHPAVISIHAPTWGATLISIAQNWYF